MTGGTNYQGYVVAATHLYSRVPMWNVHYIASLKHKRKVLDFVKSGGPELTVDRTIFEMWLGGL